MKTEVAILHHEYPTEIRDHVVSKLQQLVRFFEGTVSVRAVLQRQHDAHCVEIVANVRRGVVLVIDAQGDTLAMALDDAVERMGRVLNRHKSRLIANRRKSRPR